MSHAESREGEDAEEEELEEVEPGQDHIIFLIDARVSMRPHLLACLQFAMAVTKAKVIASSKSSLGIILFGTRRKNEDVESCPDNVFTLLALDFPSASRIKTLAVSFLLVIAGYLLTAYRQEFSSTLESFDQRIGSQDNDAIVNLKEALWLCCQNFNKKKSSQKDRDIHRIWIFTDDDNPNAGQVDEQQKVFTIAKDAKDSGGEISLWHIGDTFQVEKFYKRMLCLENDDELLYRATDFEHGRLNLSQMRKKQLAKRSLATLPFIIGEYLSITVQLFKTVEVTRKPTPTYLYRVTNEALRVSTRYIDYYGSRVEPLRIKTFVEVGGRRVYVSDEDMSLLKLGGGEGRSTGSLRLLHFMPADQLSHEMNVQSPYFIFPDDSTTKGSSHLFSALLRDVHSKALIGVGELVRMRASAARFVALLPQIEKVDDNGFQIECSGFNLIPLPFQGELRPMYSQPSQGAFDFCSGSSIQAAEDLITAFQLEDSFDYSAIENPSIQKYFAVLQAVALSEESIDWTAARDNLQPCIDDLAVFDDLFLRFKTQLGLGELTEGNNSRRTVRTYYLPTLNNQARPQSESRRTIRMQCSDPQRNLLLVIFRWTSSRYLHWSRTAR